MTNNFKGKMCLLKLTDSIIMFLKELTKTFLMEAREEKWH